MSKRIERYRPHIKKPTTADDGDAGTSCVLRVPNGDPLLKRPVAIHGEDTISHSRSSGLSWMSSPSQPRPVAICYGQLFSVLVLTKCSTVTSGGLLEFPGSVSQLGQIGVPIFLSPINLWFGKCKPQNCISVTPRGAFKKRAPRPTHNRRPF
jgi:hypothetical protein